MTVKIFENAFGGNASKYIAINPDHVMSVFESTNTDSDAGDEELVTNIFSISGNTWQVKDDYLDVVARLNEKD